MKEKILNLISKACNKLYQKDKYLIVNGRHNQNHVSEMSIVFRLGIYLQQLMDEDEVLKEYNLDCEYNRNMDDCKRLPEFENGTRPDLIIHQRGTNRKNLLVLEFKTWWDSNIDTDLRKIDNFIYKHGKYHYKYGMSIIFEKDCVKCILKQYEHFDEEFIIDIIKDNNKENK